MGAEGLVHPPPPQGSPTPRCCRGQKRERTGDRKRLCVWLQVCLGVWACTCVFSPRVCIAGGDWCSQCSFSILMPGVCLLLCCPPPSLSLSRWLSLGVCLASFPSEPAVFLLEAVSLVPYRLGTPVLASELPDPSLLGPLSPALLSSQTPPSWGSPKPRPSLLGFPGSAPLLWAPRP